MAKDLGKKIVAGAQIFTLAAAPVVFATSCDNEPKEQEKKPDPCMCDPKEHNEGEECCTGDDCTCKTILKCDCAPGTLHEDKGKECRGPLNCECENAYAKLANGIFVTVDDAVTNQAFVMGKINDVLDLMEEYAPDEDAIIKNNADIIRIHVVPGSGGASVSLIDGKHIIMIKALTADAGDLMGVLYNLAIALTPELGLNNAKGTVWMAKGLVDAECHIRHSFFIVLKVDLTTAYVAGI